MCCLLFTGGLAAVIYTDAAQTAIMLAGALTLMGFSKWGYEWKSQLPVSNPLWSSWSDYFVSMCRFCGGWRLECFHGGLRQSHPINSCTQLDLWHPPRRCFPHIQRSSDFWPPLAWCYCRHVHPLHVVLVLWSGQWFSKLKLWKLKLWKEAFPAESV